MSENPIRLQYLFNRYVDNTATTGELEELWQLMNRLSDNDTIADAVHKLWEQRRKNISHSARDIDWDSFYSRMMKKAGAIEPDYNRIVPRKWFSFRNVAAAACVTGVIAAGIYFFTHRQSTEPARTQMAQTRDDAAPGGMGAVLTLADGSRIVLDSAGGGVVARQGQITITRDAGNLVYEKSGKSDKLLYNTLSTGNGEQSPPLTLADGSRVWLNAASSIRYPVAFNGNTREVEITGEVYFEVAHNAGQPFYVHRGDMTVRVLGTHFNVNAYDNESDIKVTLLEGSVRVESSSLLGNPDSDGEGVRPAVTLKPGQQAILPSPGGEGPDRYREWVRPVDIDQVMAWRNGLFAFKNAGLPAVMRQLSRWYDVEVEYTGFIPERVFSGKIERSLMLSQVLKMLDRQHVNYKIENRKIKIMP